MTEKKVRVHDKYFKPLIAEAHIKLRVKEMALELAKAIAEPSPLFLGVLNGSFVFLADLIREYPGTPEVDLVKLVSYQGTESTGAHKELIGFSGSIKGKHVVIVEDIVDTGRTMDLLLEKVSTLQPLSLRTATLLHKPEVFQGKTKPDHIGFEIGNEFVVGYGLDYDGLGRGLKGVYQLASDPS